MSGYAAHTKPLRVSFHAGASGRWSVTGIKAIVGDGLPHAAHLHVREDDPGAPRPVHDGPWSLFGTTSNLRYTLREEANAMAARQEGLDRPKATVACLIPIRKSPSWWAQAQDERRAIYERSQHTLIGLAYLPQVARRLHHCRDLGEPFDFLTWFEFAETDRSLFEHLLSRLRATEEWTYVEREVEVWVVRS